MQIEIINNKNILKTWNRNFVQPPGLQYKQCVSLSVHSYSFHTFLLALDTDKSTFSMGRAHYSQLSCYCLQQRFFTILSNKHITILYSQEIFVD